MLLIIRVADYLHLHRGQKKKHNVLQLDCLFECSDGILMDLFDSGIGGWLRGALAGGSPFTRQSAS